MNINNICKKRLLGDLKLISKDPHEFIEVAPLNENLLTWCFLIRGPESSDYSGGYYIGKIIFAENYPFAPPNFMLLTPSGRFIPEQLICMSNSSYHADEWSAMWNIHAILTGFLSIMLDDKEHGISHIHYSLEEKRKYAENSIEYNKTFHKQLLSLFPRFLDENGNPRSEPLIKKKEKKKAKKKTLQNTEKILKSDNKSNIDISEQDLNKITNEQPPTKVLGNEVPILQPENNIMSDVNDSKQKLQDLNIDNKNQKTTIDITDKTKTKQSRAGKKKLIKK